MVRECYILLTIKEDLIIENSASIVANSDIFPNLLNIYLLAIIPTNQYNSILQIIENMAIRELGRYRIDQRQLRDWLLPQGLQKYQFNFIKIFGSEFISYNELNLMKCLNIKLKHKSQTLLQVIREFDNKVQVENFNIFIRMWWNLELKD